MYNAGERVDPSSYTVCGAVQDSHSVSPELVLAVSCGSALRTQYIIIQSLDSSAEKLCIAEVSIDVSGQYCYFARPACL